MPSTRSVGKSKMYVDRVGSADIGLGGGSADESAGEDGSRWMNCWSTQRIKELLKAAGGISRPSE